MTFVILNRYALAVCFHILQVGFSWLFRFRSNLKAECAILPPSSRVAAMPLEAVSKATCHCLALAKIKFMITVLPVPPGVCHNIVVCTYLLIYQSWLMIVNEIGQFISAVIYFSHCFRCVVIFSD